MTRAGAFLLVLASTFACTTAHADPIDESRVTPILRFDAGFHLGALGRLKGELPADFGDDLRMSPSPGAYFRADIALGRFFLFRPSLQWRSVKAEGAGGPHDLFSVQIGVGVHYEFQFRRDDVVSIEPYLFLMAGIDAVDPQLIGSAVVMDQGTSFGPSWGVRLGLITWVSRRVGVVIATGFERSDFFPSTLPDRRRHVYFTQLVAEAGVTFRIR